ncbi:response regulator [Rhodoluna sp.]|uniref:response regulator n=1 Tax=Rhodoluna sp. TaxID=1969481 RepID=UPI0025DFA084|nr:response regulator [Rhodoluna sp.]
MASNLRVLVVEDESFTRQLVTGALTQQGFHVFDCGSAADAMKLIKSSEPHVLVSDLDLGQGASGHELLKVVARDFPWIGLVVLTAHSSPLLAGSGELPVGVSYLVKSSIENLQDIGRAVNQSISHLSNDEDENGIERDNSAELVISQAQAETLRLLSQGLTNQAIADIRGTSLRAVENMIKRTYIALGLEHSETRNLRVEAVSIWRQGRVQVR